MSSVPTATSVPGDPASDPLAGAAARTLAQACNLQLHEDAWGWQAHPSGSMAPTAMAAAIVEGALSCLTDSAILRVHGDDAVRFLHSQTTNDLLGQPVGSARWHGYCSPKGRLLALMLVWRENDGVYLLLPQSLAEAIRQRLRMFVLRSKVQIADESGTLAVFGLFGRSARVALADLALDAPAPMQVVGAAEKAGEAEAPPEPVAGASAAETQAPVGADVHRLIAIGMPALDAEVLAGAAVSTQAAASADVDDMIADACGVDVSAGAPRWLLVVPMSAAAAVWQRLSGTLTPVDSRLWRWAQIRSGIASIVPATSERFVPQMLNLEAPALAAVSFTKGCYPGQEVVARSHYLGRTKRRTFLARIAPADRRVPVEPIPGSDVVDTAGQPVGVVVSAAPSPDGAADLLFSGRMDAVDETVDELASEPTVEPATDAATGELTAAGQTLRMLPLPYSLPVS